VLIRGKIIQKIQIQTEKPMSALPLHFIEQLPEIQTEKPPVLVMLHGYGSNEDDLFSMRTQFDRRFHVVSLQAPIVLDWGGYAWFPIEYTPNGIVVDKPAAVAQLENLKYVLRKIKDKTQCDKLFLLGFSQGTIMSLAAAVHEPTLISGVIGFSGRFERELIPKNPDMAALRELPIFQSHGISDPVIPISAGREAKKVLEELGVNLVYKEYPFAHEISMNCLMDAVKWLEGKM